MQPTVSGGTNSSLVFAPTDLSILARCTIVYVTTRRRQSGWQARGKGARETRRRKLYRGAGLEKDKPAWLNYC